MINSSNILLANLANGSNIDSLSGWPLAIVVCVAIVCFASVFMRRWPWEK